MKKYLKSLNLAGATLFTTLLIVSCDKDETVSDTVALETEVITVTELKYSDEAEQISDEVFEVVEDVYVSDELATTAKGLYFSDYLPDCVTVTTVVTDTTKEKTIDFGEGYELRNGNVLSGIIYMSYEEDMEVAMKTISVSLENFTFNSVAVEGSKSIVRVRSNDNGNPQGTATASLNATWPDGETATFSGTRTREWIEGYGTGFWGDNVYLITGNGTFTGKAGNTYSKEVISPLRREMACRFIVSGVLQISRNDATSSLDFGDGNCDAKGVLTKADGTEEEVFLRRFFN